MAMSSPRAAVGVAVDPFLLRSALHRCLSRDPRFESVLCPQGQDVRDFARASSVQAVLATSHVAVSDARVILVASPDADGEREALTDDVQALADRIALIFDDSRDDSHG